ncbi:MAG: AAA family ATPase [Blautia faecicola]
MDFLRAWLKDKEYVNLAYMTGILPIKKYESHSALNMFSEYSMTNPREMAEFFGFTEEEVQELCKEYGRSFEETQAWYDGYELTTMSGNELKTYAMYSPKSVVDAMLSGIFDNYWNQTEIYEALKDDIVKMLAGERIRINIGTFSNDMTTLQSVQWTGKKCSDPSGVLFCKGILHGDPGTSDRKRICRYLFYTEKNVCR